MSEGAKKILMGLFLIALLLRVGSALCQPRDPASLAALPDQVEYLLLGQNLLAHHTLFFYDRRFDQVVYAYRMPGYPIFIALCGGSVTLVRLAQAIIDAANVFAVYWLAKRFLSEQNSLIGAGLVAVNPFLIYFSGLILSETLCTAMILWGAALCVVFDRRVSRIGLVDNSREVPLAEFRDEYVATTVAKSDFEGAKINKTTRRGANLLGPIILALAVIVRPSGLLLPIVLPLVAGTKRIYALIGLVLLIALLSLWAWRNDAMLGKWIWTTTNSGITQYDGFNPNATGASDQRFVKQMPYLQQLDEIDRNNYLASLARNFIRRHPARLFSLAVAKLGRTFSPVPLSEQFSRPIYLVIAAAYSFPVFLLAFIGLIWGRGGWRMKIFLLCVPIYFAVVHALSVGSLRYRLPAEPFIALLAASGVASFKLDGGTNAA